MASGQSVPVQQTVLPPQHTPTPMTATSSATGATASTSSETKQSPPSKEGESPNADPLPQVNPQVPVDTPPPPSTPQAEKCEPHSEDIQDMEAEGVEEKDTAEDFLANIGWYEVEHAYASKPPSPSTGRAEPASNDVQGSTSVVLGTEVEEKKLELDATQVSTVKSMVVAMGVVDVIVSEERSTRGQPGGPPGPVREGVKSPHMDETKDSETSLNDDKMEAAHEKTPEKPEESAMKESKGTLPASQDSASKEYAEEKEAAVGLEREKEAGATQAEESTVSPKPDNAKGRSQTPEIDVESLASSPPALEDEGEGPSEGVSTSSRRRNRPKPSRWRERRDRERARRKTPKTEPEEVGTDTPAKDEDHTPSKDEEEEGHGGEGDDKDTPSRPDKVSKHLQSCFVKFPDDVSCVCAVHQGRH